MSTAKKCNLGNLLNLKIRFLSLTIQEAILEAFISTKIQYTEFPWVLVLDEESVGSYKSEIMLNGNFIKALGVQK